MLIIEASFIPTRPFNLLNLGGLLAHFEAVVEFADESVGQVLIQVLIVVLRGQLREYRERGAELAHLQVDVSYGYILQQAGNVGTIFHLYFINTLLSVPFIREVFLC